MSTVKISELPAAASANANAVIPATNAAGTTTEKVTVAQIAATAAASAPVQSVAGRTGDVTLAKADVGLGNVDNTSDANKPISTAVQSALDGKQAAGSYVLTSDASVTNAREWSASTVTQAAAEAGTDTARVAFTVQRVWQAIAAWWATISVGTSKIADGAITDSKITTTGLATSSLNWAAIQPWAPSTSYAKGDLVSNLGIAYRRSVAGVSGTTFNPANWQQTTPSEFVGSQITSGTIANARLTTRSRAAMNIFLSSTFR